MDNSKLTIVLVSRLKNRDPTLRTFLTKIFLENRQNRLKPLLSAFEKLAAEVRGAGSYGQTSAFALHNVGIASQTMKK